MFIHLGGDKMIRTSEIIAIFDLSIDKYSKITKQFIERAIELKILETIGDEQSKSLIVTEHKIYYSPISTSTLKKRTNHLAI